MLISKKQKLRLKNLGERLKAIRESKGLTLKELANVIDKEPQSIHRLEKGGVNPSYLYLIEVCKGLKIDITELLKELPE